MNKHSLDMGEPKLERSLETDSQCLYAKTKTRHRPMTAKSQKPETIWRPYRRLAALTAIQQDKGDFSC